MRTSVDVMRNARRVRTVVCAAAACAAGLALAPVARATDLKTAGVWTAFNAQASGGQRICGVKTAFPDSRQFYIKWFEGESVLTIQIFKDGWAIPPHVQPNVSMNFPGSKPWEAKGLDLDHEVDNIEVSVPNAVVKPFTDDITRATSGTISFPGGGEPPWDLAMAGFPVTLQAMIGCIDQVAGATSTSTPFAYLHAPQPGKPPVASGSPFGSRSASDFGKLGQE